MKRNYNTQSSSSSKNRTKSKSLTLDEVRNSVSMPLDLGIEILLKSPIKSIAKFRCLSKQYASAIRSPSFTETFFAISSSRPKLLFNILTNNETLFFSSPQPHQTQTTSTLTADFHMSFQINCISQVSRPVCGFVCGLNQYVLGDGQTVSIPLICNPSTGQVLMSLPRVETVVNRVINYLGYDPIDNQYKVLCMSKRCLSSGIALSYTEEHQVLTLETGKKPEWRMVECDIQHTPDYVDHRDRQCVYDGICINGVIYYLALTKVYINDGFPNIVCFDMRSEKFYIIKKAEGMIIRRNLLGVKKTSALVNHKGGLAKLQLNMVYGRFACIELWVLKDAQKHQWSKHDYVLPPLQKIIPNIKLCFVGTTSKGEIVLSPNNTFDSFYLLYYNPETNIITKVQIQGMEAYIKGVNRSYKVYTFLDHVEDVKLMEIV